MSKILMPMFDGGIVDYTDNMESIPGCETCNYGSEYINDITITLTKFKIHAVLNEMYDYALSESDVMKLLLPAYDEIRVLTERQFTLWFKHELKRAMKKHYKYVDCDSVLRRYDVQELDGGAE